MNQVVSRLAPTPSGYLHTGNVFNLLYNWLLARAHGGKVLLRIDDLDKARRRPQYVADIFETLDWLGLDYDTGPTGPDDLYQNWSQEHRLDLYHNLLSELIEQDMVFACNCTRRQLAEKGFSDHYPNICLKKELPLNADKVAWRVKVLENTQIDFEDRYRGPVSIDLYSQQGSFVVRRKDQIPAYQIASLADDLHFGVNTMARGEDLLESTASQLYLARVLGKQAFLQTQFYHHDLITDASGGKLAKSAGSVSVRYQRDQGLALEQLFVQFAAWAGLKTSPQPTLNELIQAWRAAYPSN